ncbi:MAG TPA: polynucleotide adenylyltransferase [Methylomirabilota bacterium]|nr:polynucleotide adenylyltransferase [Methylomirabilota bacterium]
MIRTLPPPLAALLQATPELHRAYLVGGCVRDALLRLPLKDIDVEVFGLGYDELARVLSRHGRTDLVGRSFGVVKFLAPDGATIDFTIARRDSKTTAGHKGFQVTLDPDLTPREAASRRDFTINSMMWDPRTGELIDFFNGADDLKRRILRHTSEAFVEDPLRVLRGMQFAGRFNLDAAPETLELCRRIHQTHDELAGDRVREEWLKWAARSARPSKGLHFLRDSGWIRHYPEIHALIDTPQDPEWHPEGDVFTHTCHCCDALAGLPDWQAADEESRGIHMLAVLAHDFGKPATTQRILRDNQWRVVSPGHSEAGGELAGRFLERIHAPLHFRERVAPLVIEHLAHLNPITERSVRRLAKRLEPENIDALCLIITADQMGRPPLPAEAPAAVTALKSLAVELKVQTHAAPAILMGRHLLKEGLAPGPRFKRLLDAAYEAQMEGQFNDLEGALRWLREKGPRVETDEAAPGK